MLRKLRCRAGVHAFARLSGTLKAAPVVMLAALVAGLVESADLTLLPLFGLHSGLDEHAALLLLRCS